MSWGVVGELLRPKTGENYHLGVLYQYRAAYLYVYIRPKLHANITKHIDTKVHTHDSAIARHVSVKMQSCKPIRYSRPQCTRNIEEASELECVLRSINEGAFVRERSILEFTQYKPWFYTTFYKENDFPEMSGVYQEIGRAHV